MSNCDQVSTYTNATQITIGSKNHTMFAVDVQERSALSARGFESQLPPFTSSGWCAVYVLIPSLLCAVMLLGRLRVFLEFCIRVRSFARAFHTVPQVTCRRLKKVCCYSIFSYLSVGTCSRYLRFDSFYYYLPVMIGSVSGLKKQTRRLSGPCSSITDSTNFRSASFR